MTAPALPTGSDRQIIPPVYHTTQEFSVNRTLRLVAALGMLAIPTLAQAQSITGSIAASATIQSVFAFGAPSALSFGNVTPGTAATGSGYIPMQRNIGVIYSMPDGNATGALTGPGGTIQPTYTCGVGTTSAAITTAFANCTSTSALFTVTAASVSGLVNEWVIFNGSLSAAQTNTVPGVYSGTIHVLATPN